MTTRGRTAVRSGPDSSGRPASLADVARRAGVSTGTVSRALSRPEMISDATRQRVLEAAGQLGYVANGAARALALRRTATVGAIVPRLGSSSFPTMVQALEATLAANGFTLLLSAPQFGAVPESQKLRTLIERGVDAVALLGGEHDPDTLTLLEAHRLPAVMMWCHRVGQDHCVGFDEGAAASLLIEHLAGLGHCEIGFIGGRSDNNARARLRLQGLRRALRRHRMTLRDDATVETEYGFEPGFEAMQRLLMRALPITAVVCGNDYLAAGALSALDQAGVAVPQDLSVVSFNDNEFAAFLHPPLTTVRLPIRDIGEAAGRYLVAVLRGETPPRARRLPVALTVRRSSGPSTGKPATGATPRAKR